MPLEVSFYICFIDAILCTYFFHLWKKELEDDIYRAKNDAWYRMAAMPVEILEILLPVLHFLIVADILIETLEIYYPVLQIF